MISRALPGVFLAVCLAGLGACDKPADKATDQPSSPSSTSAAAPAATATGVAAADPGGDSADQDIPTEADFEDEAEQTISTANLEEQLDALEKEIDD